MGFNAIYQIAGSAMNAQMIRLNTVASNLANADTAAGSAESVYKARQPVFSAVLDQSMGSDGASASVAVTAITEQPGPSPAMNLIIRWPMRRDMSITPRSIRWMKWPI